MNRNRNDKRQRPQTPAADALGEYAAHAPVPPEDAHARIAARLRVPEEYLHAYRIVKREIDAQLQRELPGQPAGRTRRARRGAP